MTLEPGHYLTLRYEGDAKVMCGPFPTAQHAWDWAFVAKLIDPKRSSRQRCLAYSESGEFISIMDAKWINEDLASEESAHLYKFTAKPTLTYPELIGEDGLLNF
jgi:hypothetical protein